MDQSVQSGGADSACDDKAVLEGISAPLAAHRWCRPIPAVRSGRMSNFAHVAGLVFESAVCANALARIFPLKANRYKLSPRDNG